jgi:hypothetical protein
MPPGDANLEIHAVPPQFLEQQFRLKLGSDGGTHVLLIECVQSTSSQDFNLKNLSRLFSTSS